MTIENETVAVAPDKFVWDIFFANKQGLSEHISVVTDDIKKLIDGRKATLEDLQAEGAVPREQDKAKSYSRGGYQRRPQAPDKSAQTSEDNPMVAAAKASVQGADAPECPENPGHGPMKFVAGSKPGQVSKRTGKGWNAFYACEAEVSGYQCPGRMNA